MTDNEIIKALECCKGQPLCEECPLCIDGQFCGDYDLKQNALDLINRQKAEIERLQKAGKEAVSCFTRMESLYKIKCKELEVVKSEAIKEFESKVLDLFPIDKDFTTISRFTVKRIAKEMEGGSNE